MTVEDKTILRLENGASVEDISKWMTNGLKIYDVGFSNHHALPGAGLYLGKYGTLALDLQAAINSLDAETKIRCKTAIAKAIKELNLTIKKDRDIAIVLFELAGHVQSLAAVDTLLDISYRFEEKGAYDKVFRAAFSLICSLAKYLNEPADEAVLYLVKQRAFTENLAGDALIALSEISPDNFPNHFSNLSSYLDEWYGYKNESPKRSRQRMERRKRLIKRVRKRVRNLENLMQGIKGELDTYDHEQQWWLDSLMELERPSGVKVEDVYSVSDVVDNLSCPEVNHENHEAEVLDPEEVMDFSRQVVWWVSNASSQQFLRS